MITNAASGYTCWKQAERSAQKESGENLQAYIDEHNVARSLTYQRIVDSWNQTLTDVYGDVIFFGDSITAGGMWQDYYPHMTTVNLGVVGDTIDCLINRLPLLETLMCEKCFVMIGVNDLSFQNTVETTLQRYDVFLEKLVRIRNEIGTQFYVQSVLPVREDITSYELNNQDIRLLNKGIAALAEKYEMTFIDTYELMVDQEGSLDINYSYDGLHLTEAAYFVWQEALIPYLDE